MDVFVARQPIFDIKRKIYAYELLFRSGESNGFPDIDGETATTSLLSSSFFTVGIEKIGAGKLVFINFTEELLLNDTPQLFPPDKMMVEVLEDVSPGPEIVAACQSLKDKGYSLALDDFVYSKQFEELLHLSDIIKIDFRLTPIETLGEMVETLKKYNCKLLAEKVETYDEFHQAVELGFEYFQGYFFSKPEVLKNKDLSSSQVGMLRLISKINTEEFDVESLAALVAQDVSITYKLLKYINSSHFSRLQPLSSIRQAITFLGENGFKMFVSLIATSKLSENKPEELIRTSIIRARFLEQIGVELKKDSSELFLLGLFMSIDAMLDQSIENVISKMPLSSTLKEALVGRTGDLYAFVRLVETYEAGKWVAFRFAQKKLGLTDEMITEYYIDALAWADSFE
ncbi:MAG: c-di-GMP-related signal transduction protein [Desulforhopalus sp.]|jgi:c-di-GMP-related signal transduction protein